ncbi:hypothetical protein Tco_0749724 [Tanacetum coccineum]|uniref:Uncharacterized protein n=1 Tax=Tanacetum coccineum TaxID=301880 RepID=A0ABQ4Z2T7_9ASTR
MVFSPSQFSSYWELEKDAMALLKWIQKFSKTQDIGARTAVYIFSRISFAITRGRRMIYNFQSSTDDEEIKMEDLVEIVQKTTAGFMELDSLKDDQPIQVSSEDETEIETDTETEDTSVPKSSPPSLRTVQIQELTNQLSLLQSQNIKMEEEKAGAEAQATILKAQPLYLNLKELPTEFEEVNWTLRYLKEYVEKMEIDVLADLKGIPDKLVELQTSTSTVKTRVTSLKCFKLDILADLLDLPSSFTTLSSQMAKLKVMDAIPDIMNKVAVSLDKFADVISSASQKAETPSVPSAGQVDTHTAEGKKNTNKETIIQLFQRRQAKDADTANLINKH